MKASRGAPSKLHNKMIAALQASPTGLTEGELRAALEVPTEEMAQFGRRRRELKAWFVIERTRRGKDSVYVYRGTRAMSTDVSPVSAKLRAEVLAAAHGRCGMCGRSISEHEISLHVDHKIPRDWGGSTARENLWALCADCNQGKKANFASLGVAATDIGDLVQNPSVHVRIGETLKRFTGKPVPHFLLEFVANQSDWRKRLRELRYLGWKIQHVQTRVKGQRAQMAYRLTRSAPWPSDPTRLIREIERRRMADKRSAPS